MNILSRTFRALLAMLVLSAFSMMDVRGEQSPNQLLTTRAGGINTGGAPEPDRYTGYFPRGFCRIQFFTNAPPEATASIWPQPGIAINNLAVTAPAIFQSNRRVTADFGDYGSYRGRMRKDGTVIVGRLRARNFPDSKNVNRALRLHPVYPAESYGYGAVLQMIPWSQYRTNGFERLVIPPTRLP